MSQGFFESSQGSNATDYLIEVSKGNIAGSKTRGLVMRNPSTGITYEDIWGAGGVMTYPTAAETWEIVSSDADDNATGTGARQVLVNYLDDQYVERSIVVELNGTTPVTLNNDHFRPDGAVVILSGSDQVNVGDITIRVAGGGDTRQLISAGFSASEDAHYTVPAGKMAFALNVSPFFTKGEDGFVAGRFIPFGTNTIVTAGNFPFYQNAFTIDFKALFPFPEKSDVKYQAKSANSSVEVNVVVELLIVDM